MSRNKKGHSRWVEEVIKKYPSCVVCDSKDNLQAHHLDNYKHHPDKRLKVENGVTLCKEHHTMFHCDYKKSFRHKATRDDFNNFMKLCKAFKELGRQEVLQESV